MDSEELEADTCSLRQTRENACRDVKEMHEHVNRPCRDIVFAHRSIVSSRSFCLSSLTSARGLGYLVASLLKLAMSR